MGCARNPATGERQLNLVSRDQEIELGQAAAREVRDSPGLYDHARLQRYVREVGTKLANVSERPDLPWSFQVVDDPSINAFALPGGPIFVTRGLLAHLENEAQLAVVLGHEVGHVTAEHSVNQMSKAKVAQLGLGLGALVSEQAAGLGMAGLELLFLKNGRNDERQSDELALRYARRAGYDVRAAPELFEMLRSVSAETAQGKLPNWLATHPDPEERVERMRARLAEMDDGELARGVLAEERLMAALDGIEYGEDPRDGYVEGTRFVQPVLGFAVDFPSGFRIVNGKRQVVAQDPDGESAIELTLGPNMREEAALARFFEKSGARPLAQPERIGRAAAAGFRARTDQGDLSGWVAFLGHGDATYRFLFLAGDAPSAAHAELFRGVVSSFRKVDSQKAMIAPQRLAVERLPAPKALRELQSSNPTISIEELARMNQMPAEAVLPAGSYVKVVRGPKS